MPARIGTAAPYLRAISGFEAFPASALAATPARMAASRKKATAVAELAANGSRTRRTSSGSAISLPVAEGHSAEELRAIVDARLLKPDMETVGIQRPLGQLAA